MENDQGLFPFCLKYVDRGGYNCAKCHWTLKCAGCIVEPEEKPVFEFVKYCYIAIEWSSEIIENNYN